MAYGPLARVPPVGRRLVGGPAITHTPYLTSDTRHLTTGETGGAMPDLTHVAITVLMPQLAVAIGIVSVQLIESWDRTSVALGASVTFLLVVLVLSAAVWAGA